MLKEGGGVLSHLLWFVVVDDLLLKLTNADYDTQGHADDLVMIIRRKQSDNISINSECLKHAPKLVPTRKPHY